MDDKLWAEKYRPKTVNECILPKDLKAIFNGHVKNGMIPNMTLSGNPGTGKTTVAKAMLNEIGADFMFINGSMEGNIDTLRTKILDYATTVSFDGKRKYVIVDEADGLNPQSTQPSLRSFIEQHANNCGFILTCNHKNKLSEAIISRCPVTEFIIPKNEYKQVLAQSIISVAKILKAESVEFEKDVLTEFVKRHFPDMRTVIGKLQTLSRNKGKIDSEIFRVDVDSNIASLFHILKEKRFNDMRQWVAENSDVNFAMLLSSFYAMADKYIENQSLPDLVLILAKYDYQNGFVVNPEINTVAMLTEIMIECSFKD